MRRTTIGEHPDGKVDLGTFWDGGGCVVVCGLISCSARPVPCIFASCTSKRTTVHSITVVIWRSACLFGDEREVVEDAALFMFAWCLWMHNFSPISFLFPCGAVWFRSSCLCLHFCTPPHPLQIPLVLPIPPQHARRRWTQPGCWWNCNSEVGQRGQRSNLLVRHIYV